MKKFLNVMVVMIAAVVMLSSCSKVPAGHVGVKVHLYGSSKGVDNEVLGVGRYWIGIGKELYTYPTYMIVYPFTQSAAEGSPTDESIRFQSLEGISCSVDIAVMCHANGGKVATLFQKYREPMPDIVRNFVRQDISNYFVENTSKLSISDLYSSKKIDLINGVKAELRAKLDTFGLVIDDIAYKSDIRFPDVVTKAIIAKIEATQLAIQKQNELVQSQADAAKAVAAADGQAKAILAVATAQAKANQLLNASITSTLVNYKAIEKWDGKLPTYSGGGAIPFLNINK